MKSALLAAVALAALAGPASAAGILTFGQIGTADTITGTATGGTSTTITATAVPVNITALLGGAVPVTADFTLMANSVGAATSLGGGAFQHFNGTFSLISGAINYLSGTFQDIVLGVGPALGLVSGDPPDVITFTSDVIPAADLLTPRAISLSFANVNPPVGIDGTTLASFTSTVSGDFSASAVPEPPIGFTMLGLALIGAVVYRASKYVV